MQLCFYLVSNFCMLYPFYSFLILLLTQFLEENLIHYQRNCASTNEIKIVFYEQVLPGLSNNCKAPWLVASLYQWNTDNFFSSMNPM